MHNNTNDSLIDDLAAKINCNYVSDLHQKALFASIAREIKNIEVSAYTLQAWNNALSYITADNWHCETGEQAKHTLLEWLGMRK